MFEHPPEHGQSTINARKINQSINAKKKMTPAKQPSITNSPSDGDGGS